LPWGKEVEKKAGATEKKIPDLKKGKTLERKNRPPDEPRGEGRSTSFRVGKDLKERRKKATNKKKVTAGGSNRFVGKGKKGG